MNHALCINYYLKINNISIHPSIHPSLSLYFKLSTLFPHFWVKWDPDVFRNIHSYRQTAFRDGGYWQLYLNRALLFKKEKYYILHVFSLFCLLSTSCH